MKPIPSTLRKSATLTLGALGIALCVPLSAAQATTSDKAFTCSEPSIQVVTDSIDTRTLFTLTCESAHSQTLAPTLHVSGAMSNTSEAPHLITGTYTLQAASDTEDWAQPSISYPYRSSMDSITFLAAQIEEQAQWDPSASVFTMEEAPSKWRALGVNYLALDDAPLIENLGILSEPLIQGQSLSIISFDQTVSRFANPDEPPIIKSIVAPRSGAKVSVSIESSRSQNAQSMKDALALLDANGKEMDRAWNVGAMAAYLNLAEEQRYAEKKVAQYNPHLLQEFQRDLAKIHSFTLPSDH